MKFASPTRPLREAIASVASVVDAKATLPVLKNLSLVAEGETLTITGTNLETTITLRFPALQVEAGATTLPAALLDKYLTLVRADGVTIDVASDVAKVTSTAGNTEIRGLPAADFPDVPEVKGKGSFSVPAEQLATALARVSFAAASDLTRPAFGGVFFTAKGDKLALAATDGYRLAEAVLEPVGAPPVEPFILPRKSAELLAGLLRSGGTVEIMSDRSQALFRTETLEVRSRILEGNFPDYAQIIPAKWSSRATIPTGDLLAAARRTQLFTESSGAHTLITLQPGGQGLVSVTTTGGERGGDRVDIAAPIEGDGVSIALNGAYLVDALGKMEEKEIFLELEDPMRPAVIRGGAGYLYLVMPVRV